MFTWIRCFLFFTLFPLSIGLCASDIDSVVQPVPSIDHLMGSWIFSGLVHSEGDEQYGYFFEMQHHGAEYHTKVALIDGQTNQLVFFYEDKEKITQVAPFDWHVGHAFIRYNPINDCWIFGVKGEDNKGFNFKVDMLQQAHQENETLILRPGVTLHALQTSQLNGHVRIDDKEQFVTGNKAWFGQLVLNDEQKKSHQIDTTFCRLNDENGFYSVNLKEQDASSAAATAWFDPLGNKVKMSQFISMTLRNKDQYLLNVTLPKLTLKLINTLNANDPSVAGFSKGSRGGFCFVSKHSFATPSDVDTSLT